MALLSSSFHGMMIGRLEKQGFSSRNCKCFSVKCSIDRDGPANPRRLTKFKDDIAMAAEGKRFLLFNSQRAQKAPCDINMVHAITAINRPATSVHRYTMELREVIRKMPDSQEEYYKHCYTDSVKQELNNYAADGLYYTRLYLGSDTEQLFTEFDDDIPYNFSTHMVDIGLRKLNADDIAYLSSIDNPKCVEIRERTDVEDLVEACKLLNPQNKRGSLVILLNPFKGIPLRAYVEMFTTAKVEAAWVINPIMYIAGREAGSLGMHPPEESRKKIHKWHNHLRLGGAQFGGLFLDFVEQLDRGVGNPVLAKVFLQECGRSFRIIDEEEDGAMPNGSFAGYLN